MFIEKRNVVKKCFTAVMDGVYQYSGIPKILNLREQKD